MNLNCVASVLLLCAIVPACGGATDTSGPPRNDAATPDAEHSTDVACVDPVVGAACTPGVTVPCSQPTNPCEAGYIWNCDNNNDLWIHELVECFTDKTSSTKTTAACGPGEVLFVDDAAGDPCEAGSGSGGTTCPSGTYNFEPSCCYYPTNAYCVPLPAACSGGLSCDCASTVCDSECGAGGEGDDGVMCTNAAGSVIDCLCGKV